MSTTINWRPKGSSALTPFNDIPEPAEMTIEHFDVDKDSTGRNTKGLMIRDRVAQKWKVSCVWHGVTEADAHTILALANAPFFQLRFKSPLDGENAVPIVYCGDRAVKVYKQTPGGTTPKGHTVLYEEISLNFIER